jgi:hypothetical protein
MIGMEGVHILSRKTYSNVTQTELKKHSTKIVPILFFILLFAFLLIGVFGLK